MGKNKDYRDFMTEVKKQEKAFEKTTPNGLPRRFSVSARSLAVLWSVVGVFLAGCTLFFVGYELLKHEGLWMVALIFAAAALISLGNCRQYWKKSKETPPDEIALPEDGA